MSRIVIVGVARDEREAEAETESETRGERSGSGGRDEDEDEAESWARLESGTKTRGKTRAMKGKWWYTSWGTLSYEYKARNGRRGGSRGEQSPGARQRAA